MELLKRGAGVTIYARDIDAPPASSTAPALFTPYPGPDASRFERWTRAACARLWELAATTPDSGVSIGTLREYCYAPPVRVPWLDELLRTTVLPRREPFSQIADSTRPHIDMLRLVPWLRQEVRIRGGAMIARTIESFESLLALGHRTVVNCTGVGAAKLASDPLLKPMHGQVIHVPNDIGLMHSIHDDAPGGTVTYVFRYQDRLVVGGTFDQDHPDTGTDEPSLLAMLERARHLLRFDGIPGADRLGRQIIQARAALRPTRGRDGISEDIRLEREPLSNAGLLVHHYGHGRAGASLALATAVDAADLALSGRP